MTIYIVLRHVYDSDTGLYGVDISAYVNLHDAEVSIAGRTDSSDVYEIRSVVISESRQDESSRS